MVDFIKLFIKDAAPLKLEVNPLLSFFGKINEDTGEVKATYSNGKNIVTSRKAEYKDLTFILYSNQTLIISGSLHKYYNDGLHNYNDFTYSAFLLVLKDLKDKFNIEPKECILKCLEIGVNIIPPIATDVILTYCHLHKTQPFEWQKNSNQGKYKQVEHSQYIIKIYNKALHYRTKGFEIETEILRFEIKWLKMQKLNQKGIYNLNDLLIYGLENFKEDLIREWENVLYFDNTTRIDHFSTKVKNAFKDYCNPIYWTDLLLNKQSENYKYHKKQMQNLMFKNSDNVQFLISDLISKKVDELNANTTRIDTSIILSKEVVNNNLKEVKNNICKITGLDISMQKESILLSHSGLKYYFKNDIKIFEQIRNKYLSKNWIESDFKIQIKEIAHNIRNTISNQKIKQKRIYKPDQINILNLFDI